MTEHSANCKYPDGASDCPRCAEIEDAKDTDFIAPDQAGSMVMLSAAICAGMVITVGVAIGWGVVHQLQGRIDRLQAELKTLQTFASCDAPKRPGDATVITYRRTPDQLVTRCQVITNPMDLERTFK